MSRHRTRLVQWQYFHHHESILQLIYMQMASNELKSLLLFTPEKMTASKKCLSRKRSLRTEADLFSPISSKRIKPYNKSRKDADVEGITPLIEKRGSSHQTNNLFDDLSTENCLTSPIKSINLAQTTIAGTIEIVDLSGARRGINIFSESWTMKDVIDTFATDIDYSQLSIRNELDELIDLDKNASKLDLDLAYYMRNCK
jgi:hypothetical protein